MGHYIRFKWDTDGTNYIPLRSFYTADGGEDSITTQTSSLPGKGKGSAILELSIAPGITWWKGMEIVGVDGKRLKIPFPGEGKTGLMPVPELFFPTSGGDREVLVEFWKAKAFGTHIKCGEARILWSSVDQKRVTFIWENDK